MGLLFDLRYTSVRVPTCRKLLRCARVHVKGLFSLDEGAENKFMTRNGNWYVVKVALYALDSYRNDPGLFRDDEELALSRPLRVGNLSCNCDDFHWF